MQNIILTGFEPFNAPYNPTIDVVNYFQGMKYGRRQIQTRILPVKFIDAAEELFKMVLETDPYLVISLGLAASRKEINLELQGLNVMHARNPDANGFKPDNQPINASGFGYRLISNTGFKPEKLTDFLKKQGLPVSLSDNPGKYVCNDLIYRTLELIIDRPKFGFIHLPWLEHYKKKKDLNINWDKNRTISFEAITESIDHIINQIKR